MKTVALLIGIAYGPSPVASSHILARLTPPAWMNLVFSAKQTGVPIGGGPDSRVIRIPIRVRADSQDEWGGISG